MRIFTYTMIIAAAMVLSGCLLAKDPINNDPPPAPSHGNSSQATSVRVLAPLPDENAPAMSGAVAHEEDKPLKPLSDISGMSVADEAETVDEPEVQELTAPSPISVASMVKATKKGKTLSPPDRLTDLGPVALSVRHVPLQVRGRPAGSRKAQTVDVGSALLHLYRDEAEAREALSLLRQMGVRHSSVLRSGNVIVVLDDAFSHQGVKRHGATEALMDRLTASH